MMFKLLFLKKLYDLSDEALISSAQTDMAYKFFLDLEPEAKMIDPSLLTKFRKTRITEDILEEMLKETIYTQSLATIEETSFKKLVVCDPFAWKALRAHNYPEEKMVYFADILY